MKRLTVFLPALLIALAAASGPALSDVLVLEQVNRVRAALEAARSNEAEKLATMKQRYEELDSMKDRSEITEDAYHKQRLRIRESYLIARVGFLEKLEEGIRQQVSIYKKQRNAVEDPLQKLDQTLKDLASAEDQSESDLKNLAQTQQLLKLAMSRGVYIDTTYFNVVESLTPIHAENLAFIDNELKSIRDQLKVYKSTQERLQLLERASDLRLMRVELQNRIAKTALKVTQILLEFDAPISTEFPAWLDPGKLEAPALEVLTQPKSSAAGAPSTVDAATILKQRGVDF